jgi:DNA-3-methyladenine glycosylase
MLPGHIGMSLFPDFYDCFRETAAAQLLRFYATHRQVTTKYDKESDQEMETRTGNHVSISSKKAGVIESLDRAVTSANLFFYLEPNRYRLKRTPEADHSGSLGLDKPDVLPHVLTGLKTAEKAVRTLKDMVGSSKTEAPLSRGVRPPRRLRRADLPVDTVEMARYLIGKTLVHDIAEGRMSGRVVETEGYVVGDASGHAFRGPTPRNRSLYLERGHAYVYLVYGSSHLLNITSELPGVGAGVLLRALEPLEGIPLMQVRRGTARAVDLARGPGRLTTAMGIGMEYNGADLCSPGSLWLGEPVRPTGSIVESVRIGLTREVDRVLRFYEFGNPYVSGPKQP